MELTIEQQTIILDKALKALKEADRRKDSIIIGGRVHTGSDYIWDAEENGLCSLLTILCITNGIDIMSQSLVLDLFPTLKRTNESIGRNVGKDNECEYRYWCHLFWYDTTYEMLQYRIKDVEEAIKLLNLKSNINE